VTSPARTERLVLCELFADLGPDAPTLLGEWTTRDLAAHLVMRDRRPDAAPGVFVRALEAYTEHVREREAERPWTELVELVRDGPPIWSPMRVPAIDTLANSVEFFVHHEDVRRAQPTWTARELAADLDDSLTTALRRMGAVLTRAAKGIGLVLRPPGRDDIRLRRGDPTVVISGPLGEGVLFAYGRKDVAAVKLDGPPAAVAHVAAAPFGL
jgi:uncharacterized protein (TIGR03085 family)